MSWGQESLPHDVLDDRERAQKELLSRFLIVQPGPQSSNGSSAAKPNDVTQAEFQQMARLYSDIRLGRGSIKLDTHELPDELAESFRGKTMGDIGALMTTPSGRMLLSMLGGAEHVTTIGAYHEDTNQNQCYEDDLLEPLSGLNAVASSLSSEKASRNLPDDVSVRYSPWNGVGASSSPREQGLDLAALFTSNQLNPSSEEVSMIGATQLSNPAGAGAAVRPDIVLMHELVHALHHVTGTRCQGPVGSSAVHEDDRDTSCEEYLTVGMGPYRDLAISEQAYRAERQQLAGTAAELPGDAGMAPRTRYTASTRPPSSWLEAIMSLRDRRKQELRDPWASPNAHYAE